MACRAGLDDGGGSLACSHMGIYHVGKGRHINYLFRLSDPSPAHHMFHHRSQGDKPYRANWVSPIYATDQADLVPMPSLNFVNV